MARSRNIKPGFFKNEQLAERHPLARILFSGLWTIADREGRLEDRPKRIKIDTLPYDDCDIEELLNSLQPEFIVRYEVNGERYIQILNFSKHQNPHKNEAPSIIPKHVTKEHQTSTRVEPEEHTTNPADSLNPITDSLNSTSSGIEDSDPAPLSPVEGEKPDEEPEEPEGQEPTEAYKATCYLIDKIITNNPRSRVPNKDPTAEDPLMTKWVEEMDRLNRLGTPGVQNKGYPWPLIYKLIDWCQEDAFWKGNIFSSSKFREKIVTLESQMNRELHKPGPKKPPNKPGNKTRGNFTEREYSDDYIKDLENKLVFRGSG